MNFCRCCGEKLNCQSTDTNSLLKAVKNNDLNRLKILIEQGKSPNLNDNLGHTALHVAVMYQRMDILEYLFTLPDINLNVCTHLGETAVLLSAKLSHPEITKMLIKQGADLNISNYEDETILHKAIQSSPLETSRFLVTNGFDINVIDVNGYTPLHEAVDINDFETVCMLLYYGADTSIVNEDNVTPFMAALNNNCNEDIQRELFRYEGDYNRTTSDGCSTLFLAVNTGSPLIIDLIENGANVNYNDSNGRNLLDMILYLDNPNLFFHLFPLVELSVLIAGEHSIFISFINCNYNKEEWLKALYLIIESDLVIELIDHFVITTGKCLFALFVKIFEKKNISEDEFVKFIEICLCSGLSVTFDDVVAVYKVYCNNKALPCLLNMKVEGVMLPHADYILPYVFCNFNSNFANTLCKLKVKCKIVPSLTELSRNKAIIAICTKYNINSSDWYYYLLRRLHLPTVIYDWLTFRNI